MLWKPLIQECPSRSWCGRARSTARGATTRFDDLGEVVMAGLVDMLWYTEKLEATLTKTNIRKPAVGLA